MSIIDGYLNQLQVLNQISAGNMAQFIPNQDTSFLRGGGLPSGSGIPKSRGGLESRLYHNRKPNIRREIENIGEEKGEVKGNEESKEEETESNVLPEDTNKSVVLLSGKTGQKASSSSSSSSTRINLDEQRAIQGDLDKQEEDSEEKSGLPPPNKGENKEEKSDSASDNLTEKELAELSVPQEKRGKPFKNGSTRSAFFIPNDTSLPIQATRKRAGWKSILPKRIKAGKIGVPQKFTKDGVQGKLVFTDLSSYKQWLKKKNKEEIK